MPEGRKIKDKKMRRCKAVSLWSEQPLLGKCSKSRDGSVYANICIYIVRSVVSLVFIPSHQIGICATYFEL